MENKILEKEKQENIECSCGWTGKAIELESILDILHCPNCKSEDYWTNN